MSDARVPDGMTVVDWSVSDESRAQALRDEADAWFAARDARRLEFALAALRNSPREVRERGMRYRAEWAAEHTVMVARAAGQVINSGEQHRLALSVQAAASADLDTYGRK